MIDKEKFNVYNLGIRGKTNEEKNIFGNFSFNINNCKFNFI